MKQKKRKSIFPSIFMAAVICMALSLCSAFFRVLPVCARETGKKTEDVTLAPYFLLQDADPSVDRFPLKETNVSTSINGIIAETYITQTYTNDGPNPIHATYVFPASTSAAVHGMKMQIGDEVITAKIQEKEEAKKKFEKAKSEGKSASLLEQKRSNVFTMNVANILPGDTVVIELHYTELISPSSGICQFVFPTVVGPRYVSPCAQTDTKEDEWIANPYLPTEDETPGKYNISVSLSTGVPITELSCKSHDISTAWDSQSAARITLSNPEDYAGDRDFILDYKLAGDSITGGLMLEKGEDENFFLMMVQPPERYVPEDIPPREYIFVLDTSGSMSGYPLDTAKGLIRNLVQNLEESDRFNLILFASDVTMLSPTSLPATADNVNRAIRLINQQDGGGGTELIPALTSAMSLPRDEAYTQSIVTITDGYFSGENEIFQMIQKNQKNTSFFSFGIGDAVNRSLIEGIAKAGGGEAFVVTDSMEAAETAERFRTYIQAPILTNIQVEYDGFDVYDTEPAVQPTLFAEKPLVLYGKWRGEPSGRIRITGENGQGNFSQEIPVDTLTVSESSQAIRFLWARTRVERLTGYGAYDDEDAVKREVTALGMRYSMATPYTSFVAVTEKVRNTKENATDVKQPLPLPSHVSNLAIGGYTTGSEPGLLLLLPVLLFVLWRKFSGRKLLHEK